MLAGPGPLRGRDPSPLHSHPRAPRCLHLQSSGDHFNLQPLSQCLSLLTVCSLILGSHSSRPVAPVTWFLFSDHSPLFPLKRSWLKVEAKAALHSILSHYFFGTPRPTCQFYSTPPEFVIYYVDLSVSQYRRVSRNRPLSCTLSHIYVQTPGVHTVHDFSVQLLGSQQSRMHGQVIIWSIPVLCIDQEHRPYGNWLPIYPLSTRAQPQWMDKHRSRKYSMMAKGKLRTGEERQAGQKERVTSPPCNFPHVHLLKGSYLFDSELPEAKRKRTICSDTRHSVFIQ